MQKTLSRKGLLSNQNNITRRLLEEFSLREKSYTSLVVVPLGYHAEEDFNAKLPKSRLPYSEILTEV